MSSPYPPLRKRKERKHLSMTKKNIANRFSYYHRDKDFMLWHKLHAIFTRKEYVSYEDLPEALRCQIEPFGEVIYPETPPALYEQLKVASNSNAKPRPQPIFEP